MIRNYKALLLIILLALLLRFYRLGYIPLGLDWDEVSNSYNAYSILKTARDEYGTLLPLTNRSFDDYKPPLYMYLEVPTVALLGLTPFSARLPSALFGFLTIPLFYLLARYIFQNQKEKEKLSLIATFLLAISPWHIQFSRVGFEANVGLTLTVASVTTFLYSLKNHKLIPATAAMSGLSLYAYHSQKIFIPLIMAILVLLYKKEVLALPKKYIASFIIILLIFIVPIIIFTPKQALTQRFQTTSQNSYLDDVKKSIAFQNIDTGSGIPFSKIFHNRRVFLAQDYLQKYMSHFDLNFLFTKGDDNHRHHLENMGMLYLFELPLVLLGMYSMIKIRRKENILILIWLAIAPIPASLSDAAPHAIRSFQLLPALEIVSALGLFIIINVKIKYTKIFKLAFVFWITASFLIYLHNYYNHYPSYSAGDWQYPYGQAVIESEKLKSGFDRVKVDHSVEQAYIFWLFYTKYDPKIYQQNGNSTHFANYYFNDNKLESDRDLLITAQSPSDSKFKVLKTLYYPDGKVAINIGYENK